ncbi:hypothetical protein F383_31664 [Gossypium arboreum]|uniref:Uncharacterized protein n=1 Tax=Gossypium arboreum TaxID=29729 RepID=A0A0B0PL80_GOSAR|nr:hypothetical protein F383_31664 [Gossypium arboreum]
MMPVSQTWSYTITIQYQCPRHGLSCNHISIT